MNNNKKCKTKGCDNPLTPSPKPGASWVYCKECDRKSARERMRALSAKRKAADIKQAYYTKKEGYIYIITNPNFQGWVKVGCALDVEDRLKTFQTASPHRDYELYWSLWSKDKLGLETKAHDILTEVAERKNEWFHLTPEQAQEILEYSLQ